MSTTTIETFDIMTHDEKDSLYGRIITEYGGHFTDNFPALIWGIMYDGLHEGDTVCLTPALGAGCFKLGTAVEGEWGFNYQGVDFLPGIDYAAANEVCFELNMLLWQVEPREMFRILQTAMKQKNG